MSDYEEKVLDAEGVYEGCTFCGIGFAESKNGTPYIYTDWNVDGFAYPKTIYTYLSDAAFEISKQKLDTLGFNGDFRNPDIDVNEVDLICRHSVYKVEDGGDGKARAKWDVADWGGGSGYDHKEAGKDAIRLMNAKFKKAGKPVSAPPAAKRKKKAEPVADDAGTNLTPREKAWNVFVNADHREGWEQDALVDAWDELISKVVPNVDETDFTSEDWENVQGAAVVPF